jgi:hypothetical protein
MDQARDSAGAAAVQAVGQAVAGGGIASRPATSASPGSNPDRTMDASFGSGGVLTTINGNEAVQTIVIQSDGKIITVGNSASNAPGRPIHATPGVHRSTWMTWRTW